VTVVLFGRARILLSPTRNASASNGEAERWAGGEALHCEWSHPNGITVRFGFGTVVAVDSCSPTHDRDLRLDSPLALRLGCYTRLSSEESAAIERVSRRSVTAPARRDFVSEGQRPTVVRLILDGWACAYKTTPEGKRQIVGFFVPGDFCDLNVYVLSHVDHSIAALTPVKLAEITPEQMDQLTKFPRLTRALWWHDLVHASIQREWLLNVGARAAYERVGHLLVETFFRLRAIGKVADDSCDFPPTQTDIGDATGLTAVHVNRTLQDLRADRLIELDRRRLRIPDLQALMAAAQFNPNYLHLDREGRHLDAND
jgi:CRP-like cAMP-binding protein